MDKLKGDILVAVTKQCIERGLGLSAAAIACNYFSETKEGVKIPASQQYTRELLRAAGFEFATGGRGSMGEFINVMGNGTCVVSPSRCKEAGFEPGDMLDIVFNETDKSFVIKTID